MENIDPKDIEEWGNAGLSDKLHMPHRNEFIPEKLDLVPREEVAKHFFISRIYFFEFPWYNNSFLIRLNLGLLP
jgi:hypothetical protein